MESFFLSETCKYLYLVRAGAPPGAGGQLGPCSARDSALARTRAQQATRDSSLPEAPNRAWRRHIQ